MVEHLTASQDVAGSSPALRSGCEKPDALAVRRADETGSDSLKIATLSEEATMATAHRALDHDGLLDDVPPFPEPKDTSLGFFRPDSDRAAGTMRDLIVAATTARRLGFVPEIRFATHPDDEPWGVELFVRDIPSMIRVLRESLEASKRKGP